MRVLMLLLAGLLSFAPLHAAADLVKLPTKKSVRSTNGNFVATIIPEAIGVLSIASTAEPEKEIWHTALSQFPLDFFVSNDGFHVITFDPINSFGIVGDEIVAFYSPAGLLAKYTYNELIGSVSEESIRNRYGKSTRNNSIVDGSTSGGIRQWRYGIEFADEDERVYGIWSAHRKDWLLWDIETGKLLSTPAHAEWNASGRKIALGMLDRKQHVMVAYEFLAWLRNPEDKPLFEKMLHETEMDITYFTTEGIRRGESKAPLTMISSSRQRDAADNWLWEWDRGPQKYEGPLDEPYYLLGSVCLVIQLPPKSRDNTNRLLLALVEEKSEADPSNEKPPGSYNLLVDFSAPHFDRIPFDKELPVQIRGLAPGTYQVTAAWEGLVEGSTEILQAGGKPVTLFSQIEKLTIAAGAICDGVVLKFP